MITINNTINIDICQVGWLGFSAGWTGLNRLYTDSGHQWVDGSPLDVSIIISYHCNHHHYNTTVMRAILLLLLHPSPSSSPSSCSWQFEYWGDGEPNNAMGQESCASVAGYSGWVAPIIIIIIVIIIIFLYMPLKNSWWVKVSFKTMLHFQSSSIKSAHCGKFTSQFYKKFYALLILASAPVSY